MHVRISETGQRILNDRPTALKLLRTIRNSMGKLNEGESVPIKDTEYSVRLVTSIKEDFPELEKKKKK